MINVKRVNEILLDCLLSENELDGNKPLVPYVKVEGLTANFGLSLERVDKHKEEIKSMLDQIENLPQGISFMVFGKCVDSDELWGGHRNWSELIALGIAAGFLYYPLPREVWKVLPGGVPYIGYDPEGRRKREIVNPE